MPTPERFLAVLVSAGFMLPAVPTAPAGKGTSGSFWGNAINKTFRATVLALVKALELKRGIDTAGGVSELV